MKSDKKIRVRITAEQTVRYAQTVEIPLKEWESLKRQWKNESLRGEHIEGWIDCAQVFDADPIEEFRLEAVDQNNKTIRPLDYIES